ncbi:retropepsin-like aspartic protease [Endozoicomonas elysicola]|nr:retropepsin-like aspartic protease [Endozoicomonas elysicola]
MHLADRFQAPILCILSIMIGLPLGWWLRDNQNKFELLVAPNNKAESLSDHTIATSTTEPSLAEIKTTHQKIRSEFMQALDSEQLDDALIIFQHHEKFHSDMAAELHHELINKVRHYHNNNNPEQAISILEFFTQHHYQDTELLSELATCYIAESQFSKALEVYTNARSYSYAKEEIRWFDEKIHQMARSLYEESKGLPDLEGLIPIFLRLSYLEPDYSLYRLALAESYLMLNDTESATRELLILQMDDELNEQASQLLAQLLPTPISEDSENEKTIVPLSGSGGHLAVDTLAGNQHRARLLIDTGASLTTLPHRILAELQQKKQARKIGYIDLTTATGIHRTPLYRLDQFKIGDFLVSNLEAAEFGPIDQNIDGLLGMNVLNHFNFFIDQNLYQLSLMPRQME